MGAFGQAGLPGVAGCAGCSGLVLGPGRGRRDDEEGCDAGRSGWLGCAGGRGCCWVPGGDAGMAEGIAWEGGVPGVWFDTALRGLRAGSPRTGVGGARWLRGRRAGRRRRPYERGRGRRPGLGCWGVWFDTGRRGTLARLTTNGLGKTSGSETPPLRKLGLRTPG